MSLALAEVRALFISLLILVGNLVPLAQFPASVEATVVSAATPTLVAVTGETLNGAVVGQKVTLKVRLNGSYAQGYVAILEVREKSGVTLDILTREGNVLAASPADIDFPWSAPYSGVFDVRTFVISLDESPDVLSGVASSTITIADSMAELAALEPDPVVEPSSTEIPESAAESEPAAYTFMVYMVASDLESTGYHATQDILEMMSVGSTKNVNVIIQTGGSANSTINDFRFIDFTKVQRHQVMNDEIKLIQDLGKRNMASASTLGDFVSWGLSRYPAEKYVIILWDHGAGMIGFGYDDIYDDILDLGELHEGLAPIVHQGKQFEIIGFDACLMASVEVANAITGRGKYLVASEELEPAWGLDFGAILESIDANPKQDGKALGIVIADSYLAHARKQGSEYENYSADRALTMSVIDLEKIPAMYREAGQIGDYLDRLGGDFEITHTLTKTIRETERYGESGKSSTGHLDLYHLAENLDREFPGPVNLGQKLKQ